MHQAVVPRIIWVLAYSCLGIACGSSATAPDLDATNTDAKDIVAPLDAMDDTAEVDSSDLGEVDLYDSGPADIAIDLDVTNEIPDLGTDDGPSSETSDVSLDPDTGPPLVSSILYAQPFSLSFAQVANGQSVFQIVTLSNIGTEAILVSKAEITGSDAFALKYEGATYPVGESLVFSPSHVLGPDEQVSLMVRFSPAEDGFSSGNLVVYANTEAAVNGLHIPLQGNVEMPCIELDTDEVDFHGGIAGGELKIASLSFQSCGNVPLAIHNLRLATADDLADPQFITLGVDSWSPQFAVVANENLPTTNSPWIVPPDTGASFELSYNPTVTGSALDELGVPIPDRTFLLFESDSYTPVIALPVRAYTTDDTCPVGIIQSSSHDFVPVGTTVILDGTASYAPNGSVASYSWSVDQPLDGTGTFIPNSEQPIVSFTVTTLGTYTFRLEIFDELGQAACGRPEYLLDVLAGPLLQVELSWTTSDGQEAPESADLDLHFVSTAADGPDLDADGQPDGYFDPVYDCYWLNPYPSWSEEAAGNPALSIDNSNGGPEVVTLQVPTEDHPYRIGVHYWSGPQPMAATIRILSLGQEIWASSPVIVQPNDLWSVGTISWPGLEFQSVLDGQTVIPDYPVD